MWFKRKTKNESQTESNTPAGSNPIEFWKLLFEESASWVLYKNGTCVKFKETEGDLAQRANDIMKQYGQVHSGSPAGDFSVMKPKNLAGWVVGCHHKDILTYVAPDEITRKKDTDVEIGILGRKKRHTDAKELEIIYIEDRRDAV